MYLPAPRHVWFAGKGGRFQNTPKTHAPMWERVTQYMPSAGRLKQLTTPIRKELPFLLPSFSHQRHRVCHIQNKFKFLIQPEGTVVLPENDLKSNSTFHNLYSERIFWPKNILFLCHSYTGKSLNFAFTLCLLFLCGFYTLQRKILGESFSLTKWLPLIKILICACFCTLWINISFTK